MPVPSIHVGVSVDKWMVGDCKHVSSTHRFYEAGDAVNKCSKYPEIKPASIPTMNSLVETNLFGDLISYILFSSIVSINS